MRPGTIVGAGVVVLLLVIALVWLERGPDDGDVNVRVAELVPKIEAAVGLEFREQPKVDTRSRDQVREFLLHQLEDSATTSELAGQEIALKLLGMLSPAASLRDILLSVLEEQVAGYYDPKTSVLYLVEGADPLATDLTLTHELIHALQDQHISLDSIQNLRGDDDRQLAAQAVVEGQATLEMYGIMAGSRGVPPGGWEGLRELIRREQSRMPRFAAAPHVVQEMLLFPYLSGAEFARRFAENYPDSVLLRSLPESSEQVMHESAYFGGRDRPTSVRLPAPRGARAIYENTMGEFGTRLFLSSALDSDQDAMRGAMGWDGDRFLVFGSGADTAIAWVTIWDSAVDAGEFQDLVEIHLARRFPGVRPERIEASRRPGTVAAVEYRGEGRKYFIASAEIEGRPGIIYVDVPESRSWDVLDIRAIRLAQPE